MKRKVCNHLIGYWHGDMGQVSLSYYGTIPEELFLFCPYCGIDLRIAKNTEQQVQAD